jgi:hypothetical protein
MKKYILLLLLFFSTIALFAQSKEKIKGSRNVSTFIKETPVFKEIELEDYFEVYLIKGDKPQVKVETDDNLYESIKINVANNILSITTTKEPIKFKKMIVHITYTDNLEVIRARGKIVLNAIDEILLQKLTIKSFDDSKIFVNASTMDFTLESNGDSEAELNIKSDQAKVVLAQNAKLKAIIKSQKTTFDMYQKSKATIEGKTNDATIRLDNNTELIANKLSVKNIELVAESYATCTLNPEDSIAISANGHAEINLLGEAMIQIKKFKEECKLLKKLK